MTEERVQMYFHTNMQFGEALLLMRKRKKLSQEEAAKLSGVSRNFISMMERGEVNPMNVKISILCSLFDIYGYKLKVSVKTDEDNDARESVSSNTE